ncbi:MAG: hypothetical protein JWP48_7333 [Actinoallomurus sp.]|jgi:hypothetical protein|nr:hypothetical protein [Actinoallomurus sp.]
MLTGVLIAESLHVGSALSAVPLRVTEIRRIEASGATVDQPRYWTLVDFQAAETDAERLADALAGCLQPTGGWYADFKTDTDAFVVFAGRVFRYRRGESREHIEEYARSVGVPEHQLDWED